MSDGPLGRRYWRRLIGGHTAGDVPAERGREGYSLWQRYWAALLNVRLPVRHPRGHR